ncbi:hypothetical protein ASPZODRAFT_131168 [Penicilliopsis zonata CBS 506.65]|uniref:Uncharacterized protein n=1 Tax=Penicilliopsis zonata CBS 506.65 TaxID=1073090 RepID=A0A1L9SKK0_9EURO|nr:hypothetical protein ASPZODRAFT_131168 [Penicilliopsis zonata CBS 506.65]OJJ47623.1 hypothetical protein ASPZODRAFT_131168 [Penicilliopsis zonata CBS 506.65]
MSPPFPPFPSPGRRDLPRFPYAETPRGRDLQSDCPINGIYKGETPHKLRWTWKFTLVMLIVTNLSMLLSIY